MLTWSRLYSFWSLRNSIGLARRALLDAFPSRPLLVMQTVSLSVKTLAHWPRPVSLGAGHPVLIQRTNPLLGYFEGAIVQFQSPVISVRVRPRCAWAGGWSTSNHLAIKRISAGDILA